MSRMVDQLEKIHPQERVNQDRSSDEMRLDPFIHKPQPTFWKRLKVILTFDRMVIISFIAIAAFVLTYRAAVYQSGEEMPGAIASRTTQVNVPDLKSPVGRPVTEQTALVEQSGGLAPAVEARKEVIASALNLQTIEPAGLSDGQTLEIKAKVPAEPFKPYFTLQLATYDKKDRAQDELTWLKQHGLQGTVVEGNKKYLLSMGKFEEKKSAAKKLKSVFSGDFKKRYPDAYVRYVKD